MFILDHQKVSNGSILCLNCIEIYVKPLTAFPLDFENLVNLEKNYSTPENILEIFQSRKDGTLYLSYTKKISHYVSIFNASATNRTFY